MAFNGQPILDVAQFINSDYATVYGRGDGPVEFTFSVTALFDSSAAALQFCALHREAIAVQGDLQIIDDDLGVTLLLADAVREVRFFPRGAAVLVNYKFTGSHFTTTDEPDLSGDTDYVKAINQSLTSGTTSQAITYGAPFLSAPRGISLQLSAPDGGLMFGWQIRESSRTASGFTVDFDAAVPATGYKLTGIAAL